jgi:hypothetical protein
MPLGGYQGGYRGRQCLATARASAFALPAFESRSRRRENWKAQDFGRMGSHFRDHHDGRERVGRETFSE